MDTGAAPKTLASPTHRSLNTTNTPAPDLRASRSPGRLTRDTAGSSRIQNFLINNPTKAHLRDSTLRRSGSAHVLELQTALRRTTEHYERELQAAKSEVSELRLELEALKNLLEAERAKVHHLEEEVSELHRANDDNWDEGSTMSHSANTSPASSQGGIRSSGAHDLTQSKKPTGIDLSISNMRQPLGKAPEVVQLGKSDPIERFGRFFGFAARSPDTLKSDRNTDPTKAASDSPNRVEKGGFGVSLAAQVRSGRPPPLLQAAVDFLEQPHVLVTPSVLTERPQFREKVLAEKVKLQEGAAIDFGPYAPEIVSGLLREWLHELPEPLISTTTLEQLAVCADVDVPDFQLSSVRFVLSQLSAETRSTLECLLRYTSLLLENSSRNHVGSVTELAKVIAPMVAKITETTTSLRAVSLLLSTGLDALVPDTDEERKYSLQEGQLLVRAASVTKLLELLLYPTYAERDQLISILALTHRYFAPAADILATLRDMYSMLLAAPTPIPAWRRAARVRLLDSLKTWIENHRQDLFEEKAFVAELQQFSRITHPAEDNLFFEVFAVAFEKSTMLKGGVTMSALMPLIKLKKGTDSAPPVPFDILEVNAKELAEQLTLLEHQLFASIPKSEFLRKAYMNPDTAPFFQEVATRFTVISYWVGSEIVQRKTSTDRASVIAKFIRLAADCITLKNFNSAASLVYGLYATSVTRLRSSWSKVNSKRMQELSALEALFSTTRNYKVYREALSQATPPLVPHIGLIPKDLFALEETNPTYVGELVNFDKLRMLHSMITRLLRFQSTSYQLTTNEELQRQLKNLKPLSEMQIYDLSRQVEPPKKA